jgi:hypothetical protein
MKPIARLAVLACLVFIAATGWAQQPAFVGDPDLVISVSSKSGTYGQMASQIQQVCAAPSIGVEETAGGTPKALEGLLNNKFEVSFLTNSVLWGKKQKENDPSVDRLRILLPLYNAETHIIALRSNGNVNKFSDTNNKRVGAFGGAIISTQILMGFSGYVPSQWREYASEDQGLTALTGMEFKDGAMTGKQAPGGVQIDVLYVEQGQPAKFLQNARGEQLKLLPFDRYDILQKFSGFVQASLNYSNLSTTAVPTVATGVSLVTYDYKDTETPRKLVKLRDCISQNINTFQSKRGFHAKWREVDPNAKSTWPMFAARVAATNVKAKK